MIYTLWQALAQSLLTISYVYLTGPAIKVCDFCIGPAIRFLNYRLMPLIFLALDLLKGLTFLRIFVTGDERMVLARLNDA